MIYSKSDRKLITVMFMIDTYLSAPNSSLNGGAEKQLYLLATSLNPKIFKSIVVQLYADDSLSIEVGKAGDVEIFHIPIRKIYNFDGMCKIGNLLGLEKRREIDILHTFFEKSEVVGWLTSRFSGIPIWITSRRDLGFKRKEIYRRIFRISARNCKKCIANCLAVKRRAVQEERLNEEKVEVIYNGLDFSLYQNSPQNGILRKELGILNDTPLVGMVANFNFEIKGHKYFLEAARNIVETFPEVVFLLIGDGPLRDHYEQMTNELGMKEKVRFLGKRNDVPSVISSLSISVLSSTSEGLSNVILESMAAGKPVVVTNVGGSSEIVADGVNGFLIPPADPPAMADAILNLLQNPEKAVQMGNVGKKLVQEKFSVEAMVRSYEKLYTELMKKVRGTAL